MIYKEPSWSNRGEALRSLGNPEAAVESLIALALNDHDLALVEGICVGVLLTAKNDDLRNAALLGIGHLARRFSRLAFEDTRVLVETVPDNPRLRGTASNVLDDFAIFLSR